jgi:hypothetical protein
MPLPILIPIIIFFGFFGILIIGFIALVVYLIVRSKNASWKGTVIDKIHNTKRDDEHRNRIEHFYIVVVKTDAGKEMKLGLAKEMYDRFEIGDKLKKDKGSLFPVKI